jgi:bifunctional enzyme Fae/Hps
MADIKTFDDAKIEVNEAFEETADGVIAAGAAGPETLNSFIHEADRLGIYSFLDMRDVPDIIKKLKALESLPNGVIFHVTKDKKIKEQIKLIKASFKGKKLLIGVQGVSDSREFSELLNLGCDIIIMSRYITQSRDVRRVVEELLNVTPEMREDIDLMRVHVE